MAHKLPPRSRLSAEDALLDIGQHRGSRGTAEAGSLTISYRHRRQPFQLTISDEDLGEGVAASFSVAPHSAAPKLNDPLTLGLVHPCGIYTSGITRV